MARAVCRHPRLFVYLPVLLAVLSIFYAAARLKVDMNRNDLVGSQMKYHRIYMQFEREFPREDNELVAVVQSGNPERNRRFVEDLAARIRPQTNLFADTFYKGDLATLGRKGLLLAPANALADMRRSLRQYRPLLEQFALATNLNSFCEIINGQFRMASAAASAQTGALMGAIPFLQRIVAEARLSLLYPGPALPPEIEGLLSGGAQAQDQIYVTFDHGRVFLLTTQPRTEAETPAAIEHLRQAIHQTEMEVPAVNAGLTGGPVLDYDEMRQSEHDSILASIVALVLCSLIFIVAYREVVRPLKTAFCLLIGLGCAMGFTTLAIGHLNILTITFAPMLIGLAIDFGVHCITRFEEETRKGRGRVRAIFRATTFTGQGIVVGAFTTAAAFLAMAATHFKGIQEMGVISGGGLLICLVPMMTTLPALLGRRRKRPDRRRPVSAGLRRAWVENLWLRHSGLLVMVALLLCAGAALVFPRVHFDYNLLHMQSPDLPSVVYEDKPLHFSGQSALSGAVVADSLHQAREFERKLKALPVVASVQSAADFITPGQAQKLALVRSIKQELAGIYFAPIDRHEVRLEQLDATLWYLTGYLGLAVDMARAHDPAVARQLASLRREIVGLRVDLLNGRPHNRQRTTRFQTAFLTALRRTFNAIKNQDTTGPLRPQDLAPALRARFIGVTGKYLLRVYSRKDLWQHANQREFLAQVDSVVPPERVTGTPVQLYEYTTLLKTSYQQAAYYAVGAIILMVFLQFRSLWSVLLALLPVATGVTWLIGFMGVTGTDFNPANIMTLPLLVGIGVTNGIQILNRFAEEQTPGILTRSTGKAVLVSGLVAIAGFGSLMLAQHRGIRSLGLVMSVGIAACMLAALAVLPAVLNLLSRYRRGRGLKI